MEYRAALLASHGIASMALDYLTCKYTMETGKIVEQDYFEVNVKEICGYKTNGNMSITRTLIGEAGIQL